MVPEGATVSADPMVNVSPAADLAGVMVVTVLYFGANTGCDRARDEFLFKADISCNFNSYVDFCARIF